MPGTVEGSSAKSTDCSRPAEVPLDLIGRKGKAALPFQSTHGGKRRFAVLRKISGVSERMLTLQLREHEDADIVHREVSVEVAPKVGYSLTDCDKALCPITEVVCEWGKRHVKRIRTERNQRNGAFSCRQ